MAAKLAMEPAGGPGVTTQSNGVDAHDTGALVALRRIMPRDELFALIAILACANGLVARVMHTVSEMGWADAALVTFGISAIVLISCFIGVSELLRDKTQAIQSADLAVAIGLLILIIVPIAQLSWVALTGLSLYILVLTDNQPSRRRGAIILLATAVPMLWSRILFNLFANLLLEIDASLVGWLLGTNRVGNMVQFVDGSGYLVVFPACSSIANMSLAFLCWITISVSVRHKWSARDLLWGLLACISTVTVNVVRMSLMALSPAHFEAIHGPWGETIVSLIMLSLAIGISLLGVRRELVART